MNADILSLVLQVQQFRFVIKPWETGSTQIPVCPGPSDSPWKRYPSLCAIPSALFLSDTIIVREAPRSARSPAGG